MRAGPPEPRLEPGRQGLGRADGNPREDQLDRLGASLAVRDDRDHRAPEPGIPREAPIVAQGKHRHPGVLEPGDHGIGIGEHPLTDADVAGAAPPAIGVHPHRDAQGGRGLQTEAILEALPEAVAQAVREATLGAEGSAIASAMILLGGVALIGAIFTWVVIGRRRARSHSG